MFIQLAIAFITLPILELLGLWAISKLFGVIGMAFVLVGIVVTGLLGAAIIRLQGGYYWKEFHRQLDRGETPTFAILHGLLLILAAFFLIVPGILTDIIGLLLLLSPIRAFVISYLLLRFEQYRLRSRFSTHPPDVFDVN
ncbi:MAG: FxsA family protein [Thermoguttaceae bacterium]